MLRGFYTAASGILTQERTLNVLTNNMANVNTPGFRASRVVTTTFEHEFLTRIEGENTGAIGKGAPIRMVSDVPVRFDPSMLEESGRPYDVALDGQGFFNIQATGENDNGQYLTRNGSFDINEQNQLVLPGVGLELGRGGPITLETSDFTVEDDGSIYDSAGRNVDTLLVTLPPEDAQLEQVQNGLYRTENMDDNLEVGGETKRVQGWIERSNIDVNREYAMVMEAQRAFQACSTALKIIDDIDQKAATQIASL